MDPWANGASSSCGPGSVCPVGPIFRVWSDVWVPIFKPYQFSLHKFERYLEGFSLKAVFSF